jgi:hypothetical protein
MGSTTFANWTWTPIYRFNMRMNHADTGWMLVATALVLLMTPALAFLRNALGR